MDLVEGLYEFPQRIEQGGTEHTIHPAAIRTAKGLVLLDAGYASEIDQLESHLSEAGFDWKAVRGIVVTHQDGDHAGAVASVVDRSDATVFAHVNAAPYIDGRNHPVKAPADSRYPPAVVDVEVVDGVTFQTVAGPMEVLFTPGHAPGHVSLYFGKHDLLIAADALTATTDGLAGPSVDYTLDMPEALRSAERLADRSIDGVLCYHGGYVEAGPAEISQAVADRR